MPVAMTCAVCGEGFTTEPSRVKTRRYCSKPCQNIGRTKRQELVCSQCGKGFVRAPSEQRGIKPFCSIACALSGRHAPIVERFWAKVNRDGPLPPHRPELGPCWLWTAARHPDGYGSFGFNGRPRGAHIFAYIQENGELTDEAPCVLHACDGGEIGCVRPSHLFAGTIADNNRDMAEKGRAWWSRGAK